MMKYLEAGGEEMKVTKQNKRTLLQNYIGLPKEIYILFIARIINSLGRFIGPLLTLILTKKIGMSTTHAGVLFTISMVLQAPCVLLGGRLADTIGRKKVICFFFFFSATLYLLCAFLPHNRVLAYSLILESCLQAFSSSAYDAMITDYTTKVNRQASFSLLYMGNNIGMSISPVIGGLLFQKHLKLLFLGDAITTFIAVALILFFVKEHAHLKMMIESGEEEQIKQSVIQVLKECPMLVTFSLVLSLYSFVYMQYGFGIPLGADAVFGKKGPELYGIITSINCVTVILLTPFFVHITQKMKIKVIISIGGFCYGACFFVLAVSHGLIGYIMAILLLTAGEILGATNIGAFIANNAKETHLGRINSVVTLVREIGGCISPVVVGKMLNLISIQQAFAIIGAIGTLGGGLMLLLRENKEQQNKIIEGNS